MLLLSLILFPAKSFPALQCAAFPRVGLVASLCRDSPSIRLHDILHYTAGGEDQEPAVITRSITPDASTFISGFSWHPTHENRLLTASYTGALLFFYFFIINLIVLCMVCSYVKFECQSVEHNWLPSICNYINYFHLCGSSRETCWLQCAGKDYTELVSHQCSCMDSWQEDTPAGGLSPSCLCTLWWCSHSYYDACTKEIWPLCKLGFFLIWVLVMNFLWF